jgi:hypothetical protein
MTRWKFQVETIDPRDVSKKWIVGVTEDHYRRIRDSNHEKEHARLLNVREVLEQPIAVYRGWDRIGQEDGFVYVGKPECDFHRIAPMIQVPAPPGFSFLVFVHSGGKIDAWVWRKHIEDHPGTPEGNNGELLWPLPQNPS